MISLPNRTCLCCEQSRLDADVRGCVPTAVHSSVVRTVVWKRLPFSIGIDLLSPFGIDPTNPSFLLSEPTTGAGDTTALPLGPGAKESFFSAAGRTGLGASVDASARARDSMDVACIRRYHQTARTPPSSRSTWSATTRSGASPLVLPLERRNSRPGHPPVRRDRFKGGFEPDHLPIDREFKGTRTRFYRGGTEMDPRPT